MGQRRRQTSGFTLTEVLMAVGILGIGVTMVATIFPVAISQSRQSDLATQAALHARGLNAGLRIQRQPIAKYCHDQVNRSVSLNNRSEWPSHFRGYAPRDFLYHSNRTGGGVVPWAAGQLYSLIIVGPVDRDQPAEKGPWRAVIAVYRSWGEENPWGLWQDSSLPRRAGPGEYILDYRTNRNYAYLIDSIEPRGGGLTDDRIFVAAGRTSTGQAVATPSWITLHGAVAVYHTIVGD